MTRRRFLLGGAAALAAPGLLRARTQGEFPSRPITLLVPWPAGGATDLSMRILGEQAGRRLGQTVIIENRPGAGGTMAMPLLQQAAPDGYTIAQLPQTILRAPWTHKVLWDPLRDVTPIVQISGYTFGVVVPADSPLRKFEDVFAWAKAHPGELTVGTNGVGTTPHIVIDQLMQQRGLEWVHVPYKGTAEQMVAVASGQPMVGVNSTGFAPFVENGQLRLLATFADKRSRRWPQAPTLLELGYGIVAMSPYGIGGPHGLPADVLEKLHRAFHAAMLDPVHLAEIGKYDQELAYLGPRNYEQALREAFFREKEIVARLGLARSGG
ncbi:MAG TPA: tripartite tricarboxylate transporter substrate binding protein [Burkholderiaceae bacterium]|nr:tripartite tricarboxylate transporter substrate binding protein [Burkholderiaceae bacterium]